MPLTCYAASMYGVQTFTIFLRGEAFVQHSTQSAAATASVQSPAAPVSAAVPPSAASPAAALALVQSAGKPSPSQSDEKSGFSDKLRTLHERVAEISRSGECLAVLPSSLPPLLTVL